METITSKALKVYLRELDGGTIYYFGACTENDINTQISEEELFDGYGNLRAILADERKEDFTVTNLFHNTDTDEIVYGAKYNETTVNVMEEEVVAFSSESGTVVGEPDGSTVLVIESDGTQHTCPVLTKTITATGVPDGSHRVVYSTQKTAKKLSINSKSFPTSYYVEMSGIGIHPETSQTNCKIVYKYFNARPDGSLSRGHKKGNQTEQIKFKAQSDANGNIGEKIVIPV